MGHPGTTGLAMLALTDKLYEYVEKPGDYYERLGEGKHAGSLKERDDLTVYRHILTGKLYLRGQQDFIDRMVLVKNPKVVVDHVAG